MKRLPILFLALCLLFTGCGWMDGSYHSVTPHHHLSGLGHLAGLRYCDSEELVAFSILAFAGLEEAWQYDLFLFVRSCYEISHDLSIFLCQSEGRQ